MQSSLNSVCMNEYWGRGLVIKGIFSMHILHEVSWIDNHENMWRRNETKLSSLKSVRLNLQMSLQTLCGLLPTVCHLGSWKINLPLIFFYFTHIPLLHFIYAPFLYLNCWDMTQIFNPNPICFLKTQVGILFSEKGFV